MTKTRPGSRRLRHCGWGGLEFSFEGSYQLLRPAPPTVAYTLFKRLRRSSATYAYSTPPFRQPGPTSPMLERFLALALASKDLGKDTLTQPPANNSISPSASSENVHGVVRDRRAIICRCHRQLTITRPRHHLSLITTAGSHKTASAP